MLEVTMTTEFRAGTNLKGAVAGGNWVFVLPSLDLSQVVSMGVPSTSTLATLSRTARTVVVVCRSRRQGSVTKRRAYQLCLENVDVVVARNPEDLDIQQASTDLVVLANRSEVLKYSFSGPARAAMQRWLTRDGQIYFQTSGLELKFLKSVLVGRGRNKSRASQVLWLTPLSGESHTFSPLGDPQTMHYFVDRNLTSISIRPDSLKYLSSQLSPKKEGSLTSDRPNSSQAGARRASNRKLSNLQTLVRKSAQAIVRVCNRGEQTLQHPRTLGHWFGRRGVLIGSGDNLPNRKPPKYLIDIANRCGVSIDSHRWGLSASGDYDSRKLIFFLFREDQASPEFVVKMTRAANYNARLKQEAKALRILEDKGIGDRQTLPRVVFSGIHGGLSIVGETAIDGVPFDRRSNGTAGCPYARAAIEWLTALGAETVAPLAAQPGEVTVGLRQLLARFTEMYDIRPDEHAFLNDQISLIEYNQIPLVFQHGDPGRWNVFVTPNGRISFLDWEAAEPNGMPLWDLLYFLRSFCMAVAESHGAHNRLQSLERFFLNNSLFAELAVESISNYCVETGLASSVVEPLFYTCWMHRALKESTRLSPATMAEGHYVSFLRLCMEKRNSPTLRKLFTLTS